MPLNQDVLRELYPEKFGDSMVNPLPDARRLQPEQAAEGIRVGREMEVEDIIAADNLPQLQEERDQAYWENLVKTSPKTAGFVSKSPVIAAATQDNLENLSGIEQTFTVARKLGRAGIEGLRSASAGAVGLARLPFDVGAAAIDPLVGTILPENPLARGAQWLEEYQQEISDTAKAGMPKGESNIESGVYSGVASLTRNLAALPMAFLPGGQGAALGAMVAPVAGESYGQARDDGQSIAQSAVFGTSQAAIEYATEKLPLTWLLKDLKAGSGFLKTLGKQALAEVPGEQFATVFQDLNEWAVINPDKPFSDYIAERPDAAVQTLIATLVGTGGQVTVMEGVSKAIGYAEKRATKADQAEQSATFIENINQLAAADKLLQRDADSFESFVAAAAEDGPVDTVFVDGRMLMQSGMAPALADLSPSVRDQLDRAILTGGDISIPVAEYAARIAPTEFAPQLLDHLKTEADGFTRTEAQDFMANQGAELQAEVERILTDRQDADTFRASQDVVKADILGQLNTAGRFTPQVNEAYATLASSYSAVRAAQLRMTPEQFHAERGMRVQGAAVAGQQFSQGGKLVTDTPAFQNWFGESKVADMQGRPVVVYHGSPDARFMNDDATFRNRRNGSTKGAHWFTTSKRTATTYADDRRAFDYQNADPDVIPAYLSMQNPLIVEANGAMWRDAQKRGKTSDVIDEAQANGHDGVIIRNVRDDYNNDKKTAPTDTYVVFESTQIKHATQNRGTFDPADPNILNQPDGGATTPRGSFSPASNTVTLLKNADLTTFLHESAHYFFESDIKLASELLGKPDLTPGEQQIVDDVARLLTWHGINGDVTEQLRQWHTMDFEEQRSHHELTAESFEVYLFSGKAPSLELQPVFQRFASWMVKVYESLKAFLARNPEAGKLNDEVRQVFDRMIATREEIALAEQARSMMPLFSSPETSGMTPDEYAKIQAQHAEATATAVDELQAKGMRDLQWLNNAKGKQVARLKRESNALRSEVEIEARREVMSQPVYRAWEFLTGKAGEKTEAQTENELEVADWKQRRQEAMDAARDQAKKEAWDNSGESKRDYDSGRAKGMAKGQLLARNKKDIDLIVARAALDWDRANPKPEYAKDSNVFDTGEQVFGKFNRAALEDMGVPEEITAHIRKLRMTATDGMHPDHVAMAIRDESGKPAFSSGDELVRTLAAAQSPKEAITELADRLMLERHGELATPEAIELAADAAIHNDMRARMVTTEYNALAKATGQRKLLTAAAKEYAAQIISRLKVRDIRPSQYANAETRAAKAAMKASAKGDLATAAAEKRNQVINTYATRAAYDAKDEVTAGLRYLKRFDKRSKTIDPEYQDQIEAMLERFELRAISNKDVDRRTSLAKWIESQREAGMEPDLDPQLVDEAFRTSYKNMTVEEFRGLLDAVKQIEHMGRLKNELLTAKDKREFKATVGEVSASIVENGGKARKVELEGPSETKTAIGEIFAGHRKLASLIRQMDGGKDNGPFWRVFVRAMNEAGTHEAVMNEQATVDLMEIYKPILDMKGGINGDLKFIPEIGDSLTRAGRLSVALNWGNATNRKRIMEGDGWSEYQVQAILNRLSKAELEFVNNMWAYIDTYWPQIEAKEKRVTGRAPEKVKADPFTLMVDGETISMRGGYYPLKYDSNRADRAGKHEAAQIADEMKRGALVRSTTARGHTEQRVEDVGMPVRKSLDVITQHIAQVTHDLAWHEWLVDANRLLDNPSIAGAIRDHYGKPVLDTMRDGLSGIATGDLEARTRMDKIMLHLRANVSRSTMGLSLTTAFLQPFGLLQSMVRIGPKHVLRGVARWGGDAAHFESSMKWISGKSDFMRLRNKTFNRELHEIRGRVSHGHSKARQIYDASLFMLMQKMQAIADVPTWIGAYEKALSENHDDATAVALADQSVLDSQGGGQTKDMAQFQRKHPFLTMFYSYFSTTLNLVAESTAATNFKNPLAVAGWASDMALLIVIPALAPAMLLAFMKGGGCDDAEDCAVKMTEAQVGYLLGLMLGVRELSGAVAGYDYSGPPVGRVITELERAGTQVAQGEADEAAAMSAISLLGVTLGIPTVQILRSYRGWKAWEDGEAPATSILLGPPPKD